MGARFQWVELRTTDPDAAQDFYGAVAGWRARMIGDRRLFFVGEEPVGGLMPLPERARARGAPAHFLGHIGVADVAAQAQRMVGHGGEVLGPIQQTAAGDVAILRDPQGAVFALSSQADVAKPGAIGWHELHTTDREGACAAYVDLFGWRLTEKLELGPPPIAYQTFSWAGAERSVGAALDSARAPHIHTHWLHYLTVDDLDAALASVRSRGGTVIHGPLRFPSGARSGQVPTRIAQCPARIAQCPARIAQCEDPQGAAFALSERSSDAGAAPRAS